MPVDSTNWRREVSPPASLLHVKRWVYTAAGVAVVLVAGLLVWRPWASAGEPCGGAISPTTELPAGTALDEVASPEELAVLSATAVPFGEPRVAVPEPLAARLTLGGVVVQQSPGGVVGGVDARTGERRWAVRQQGTGYGAVRVGGRLALAQQEAGEPLTVADVGVDNGEVRACVVVEDAPPAGSGTAVAVAEHTVALLRRAEDASWLSLVDPAHRRAERTVEADLPASVVHGQAAGDVLVFDAAGTGPTGAWELVTDQRDTVTPADRRVYAFDTTHGEPLWDYAHDNHVSQVVGTFPDVVVVRATRLDGAVLRNHLIALDAHSGEQRWATALPDSPAKYYEQATLLADVVITSESHPTRGAFAVLVGRDLYSGQELWRIENRVTALDRAALIGGFAAVPGRPGHGLELIDLRGGGSTTAFDGVTVLGVTADGTSIGLDVALDSGRVLATYDRAHVS